MEEKLLGRKFRINKDAYLVDAGDYEITSEPYKGGKGLCVMVKNRIEEFGLDLAFVKGCL